MVMRHALREMGHGSDFSTRDCTMHHEFHEYSTETPEFLTKTVFHLSLSHFHLCAIRSFVLLIDHNVGEECGGMDSSKRPREKNGGNLHFIKCKAYINI